MRAKRWVPSNMEQRALEHLGTEEAWRWLGQERPDESQPVGWKPFRRIFGFNLLVFLPIFVGLAAFGWRALAADDPNMALDAPTVLTLMAVVLLPSALMALVATGLYRRSWNRRARSLQSEEAEEI